MLPIETYQFLNALFWSEMKAMLEYKRIWF